MSDVTARVPSGGETIAIRWRSTGAAAAAGRQQSSSAKCAGKHLHDDLPPCRKRFASYCICDGLRSRRAPFQASIADAAKHRGLTRPLERGAGRRPSRYRHYLASPSTKSAIINIYGCCGSGTIRPDVVRENRSLIGSVQRRLPLRDTLVTVHPIVRRMQVPIAVNMMVLPRPRLQEAVRAEAVRRVDHMRRQESKITESDAKRSERRKWAPTAAYDARTLVKYKTTDPSEYREANVDCGRSRPRARARADAR